ncbi:MAG: BMC domain-containing protein [Deltaproteobacteria bacterium]
MPDPLPAGPCLALLEIDGIARGYAAADALLKRAGVKLHSGEPVTPGKYLLLFSGGVAEVSEALEAGAALAGDRLLDRLLLPQAHPELWLALTGARPQPFGALAIVETLGVAGALSSADAACKAAKVALGTLQLARGIGGKGYFTLHGEQHDLEAALEAAVGAVQPGAIVDTQLIAAPHPELEGPVLPAANSRRAPPRAG